MNSFSGIELPQLVAIPKDITPKAIAHLIETADAQGRPEIGDMIYVGIFLAQRQTDRFLLTANDSERLVLTQSKTKATISLNPQLIQPLIKRLLAAKQRRAKHKVLWPNIIINEKAQKPFNLELTYYRNQWRKIVKVVAVEFPILEGFQDQNLRKVAMTWMHTASATDSEVAAGHSDASMSAMKKHYVHKNAEMADNAIIKFNTWLSGKEVKL